MIGKTISHYNILDKLGEGGMGVVYKAEDSKLKRFVALKFLSEKISYDSEEKVRFLREARAAAALDHPNIVAIHEITEVEGQSFIAMAYVEGSTLKQKFESGLFEIEEAIELAKQIAEGLYEAHEKGIVHRDIKSANIMLTSKGQVKITDFGLAKIRGDATLTKSGSQMGTAAYMSPEQIQGEPVDHRSDIFSFGVLLYEMFSGQLPFHGENEQAAMYSILYHEPVPLLNVRPDIPVRLAQIVEKSLEKDKENRYQTIDVLLADLKNIRLEPKETGIAQPSKIITEGSGKYQFKIVNMRILIPITLILFLFGGFLLLKPYIFKKTFVTKPTTIAVISFENQTGDKEYDYLQKAIPNLLITSLEQSPHIQITTWERLNDLLKQIGKDDVKNIDRKTGFELCRLEGIETIVLGSFTKAGDIFATDVKVLDVETKELLISVSSKGNGVGSILERQIDELSREASRGIGLTESKIKTKKNRVADITTTSMDAYNYFLRGREDYEKVYFNDAKKFLEKAVVSDSTFAVAYLYLAWTYGSLRQVGNQKQAYEKAKMFSQKATEKERLYIEAAYAGRIEGDPEKRFQILKRMAKKFPKEKRVHSSLGWRYRDRKLYDKSIEAYNKALELDTDYGGAMNGLAYTYSAIGNYEKSIDYYKMYASVSPGDANPFDSMAELYFKMGRFDEALAKFKEALEVKPDFGSELSIAYIYALQEDYDSTMRWIDQNIKKIQSPAKKVLGYAWKGLYHYWLGCYNQSIEDINKAIELTQLSGNDYGTAVYEMVKGWMYYHNGEFELSRKGFKIYFDFSQGYHYRFDKLGSFIILGFVDVSTGQIDSAKAKVDERNSLLNELSDKELYWAGRSLAFDFLRMEILMAEGAFGEAIAIGEKVSPVNVRSLGIKDLFVLNIPFLQDILARAYHQNGELNKAIAEYEQLITFDPNSKDRRLIHPKYRYRLAKLYEQKGWPGKAIEQYEKFLEIWKDADEDLPELIDAKARLGNCEMGNN
jgi:serine/threonine protein kinase